MKTDKTTYDKRYVARIVIEAKTPLRIGTGHKNMLTDAPVMRDVNGLPYIPGTSIAGVLRHAVEEMCAGTRSTNDLFGFQNKDKGHGSHIIFTEAKMVGPDGRPVDGMQTVDWTAPYFSLFYSLPIRQHVRIGGRGTAEQAGKFDEEVVLKGTRFCFEMEVVTEGDRHREEFDEVISRLYDNTLRIGGGTRKGFGAIEVIEAKSRCYDLSQAADLDAYLSKSTSLAKDFDGELIVQQTTDSDQWYVYELKLQPDDFMMFGSGLGDDDADLTPVRETYIDWTSDEPQIKKDAVLIPATSLKGALAHRTAYHHNRLCGRFADTGNERGTEAKDNKAVQELFGHNTDQAEVLRRGNVIFNDIIEVCGKDAKEKLFNHVAIDRFTGGTVDGALYSEKAIYAKGETFTTRILVKRQAYGPHVFEAFKAALDDLCNGMLPLGGLTNRGHGTFTGTYDKKIIP